MGGGTSIWASPEWKSDPREIFNWKLWYLTTTVAFAGCSYGFDQGNIGGVLTLPSFKKAFGLDVLSENEADERGMCASNPLKQTQPLPILTRVSLQLETSPPCVRIRPPTNENVS